MAEAAAGLVPLLSEINSLAIDVSRLRLAMDACADSFREVLAGGCGGGNGGCVCESALATAALDS